MALSVNFTPTGTAPSPAAAQASLFSSFFFSSPNLLSGIDASPRVPTGTGSDGMLGPGSTLGVDVGVGNNGEVYLRGQAGADSTAQDASAISAASSSTPATGAITVSPMMLLAGLAALFFLTRK
jgi:hypothetical protein